MIVSWFYMAAVVDIINECDLSVHIGVVKS